MRHVPDAAAQAAGPASATGLRSAHRRFEYCSRTKGDRQGARVHAGFLRDAGLEAGLRLPQGLRRLQKGQLRMLSRIGLCLLIPMTELAVSELALAQQGAAAPENVGVATERL